MTDDQERTIDPAKQQQAQNGSLVLSTDGAEAMLTPDDPEVVHLFNDPTHQVGCPRMSKAYQRAPVQYCNAWPYLDNDQGVREKIPKSQRDRCPFFMAIARYKIRPSESDETVAEYRPFCAHPTARSILKIELEP